MQFSFFATMHSEMGQRSLEDVCSIVGHQLRALGHKAVLDPRNAKMETAVFVHRADGINVLVEGFTRSWVEIIAKAHAWGARFLILATEEPTPKGFNWGTGGVVLGQQMVDRQKIFPEAAKYADGIIHLVPGDHVTRWYGQFAPAAYSELGYAPTLLRINNAEPEFDFGFYGSLTPRRHRLLKRLAKQTKREKAVKLVVNFETGAERDRQMARACVILQVRKHEEMGLVSSSRCNTALSIGRPVVAEPHDLCKPWDEVVRFTKKCATQEETERAFINEAMLVRSMWKGIYQAQLAKFKEKFSPELCIGRALDQLGILEKRRLAS